MKRHPIEIEFDDKSAVSEILPDAPSGTGVVVIHHMVTLLIIVVCLAFGVWSYLSFKNTSFFVPVEKGTERSLQSFMVTAQNERLHAAIQTYFKMKAEYPTYLKNLVEAKILETDDLHYPPNAEFKYEKLTHSYTLNVHNLKRQ